jgi:hypothetical protein
MATPRFTWTDRARPVIEIGIGDVRVEHPAGQWDVARWDDAAAHWSGLEPEWKDVACDAFTFRCEYGRQRSTDRFVAGAATVVVWNATGWADPKANVEPGILTMRPGRAIRLGVYHATLGTRWLFRGFIDAMSPVYDPTLADTVELSCIDALGEVNRAKLPPIDPPTGAGEPVDVRIGRILDAALWPAQKRVLDPTGDTLLADAMGGQVADLIGRAADSGGGNVYGDTEARIVYRARDWQTFAPGTPPDGSIGNVEMSDTTVPGTPQVDGYLTPTVGTVTTPDPGPLPAQCVFVFTATGATNDAGLVAQFEPAGQYAFVLRRNGLAGNFNLFAGAGATAVVGSAMTVAAPAATATAVQTWAVAAQFNGAGLRFVSSWSKTGAVWMKHGDGSTQASLVPFDANTPVRIGAQDSFTAALRWGGRIYSVELRTGLDPAAGAVLWRFDANDYPGTGTAYVDPRGRTWTLTDPTAITPKVPAGPDVVVPADVCPVRWERPFARSDLATRVIIGRDTATALVLDDPDGQLLYGIEPFERTDLLTERDDKLLLLGQRIMRVRSAFAAPRIRSVTLDARTSDDALDLMSSVDVYKPSRYRCRLRLERGDVFDAEHFATGVVHEVTPSQWTLDLNLDLAEPYAAAGGKWDGAYWDQATWGDDVAVLIGA